MIKRKQLYVIVIIVLLLLQGVSLLVFSINDSSSFGLLVLLLGFFVIVAIIQAISDKKRFDEEITIFGRKIKEELSSGKRCKRCKHELTDSLYCENCGFPTDVAFNNLADLFESYEYAFNEREESLYDYFEYIECRLYLPEKARKEFSWPAAQLEESVQFLINHFKESVYTDNFYQLYLQSEVEGRELEKTYKKHLSDAKSSYQKGKLTNREYNALIEKYQAVYEKWLKDVVDTYYGYVFEQFKNDMYVNPLTEDVLFSEHFQLEIRDKIEDESKRINKELKEMHNSSVLQSEKYFEFEELLNDYENLFNKDTIELKNNLLRKLIKTHHIRVDDNVLDFVDSKLDIDYMDGHEFEHFCANLLKNNGFINVDVTPGSGDQGVDVLAEKDGISYAIQCKCYSGKLGNTPIQEVVSGKTFYRCHIAVVMTNSYFTDGAKELAKETGTLLWDRDKLESMIELSESKI